MTLVFARRRCVGFMLHSPRGIQAFDRDERPLGFFSTPILAAQAVENAAMASEEGKP
jgi:hypothetical protein